MKKIVKEENGLFSFRPAVIKNLINQLIAISRKKISPVLVVALLSVFMLSSCAVIRPGEVGVRQKLGRLSEEITTQGTVFFNPFTSKVVKTSIQTNNLELSLSLPSKEGLSITSQISILYRLDKDKVPSLIRNLGLSYQSIIANVFRSASADVCSKYFAKDMHTGQRSVIEKDIKNLMDTQLKERGFVIESADADFLTPDFAAPELHFASLGVLLALLKR